MLGDPWSVQRWCAVDILAGGQARIDPAARRRLVAQLLRDADPTIREHARSHYAAGAGD